MIGNVKVWFADRDFGFIAPDDGSGDLFFGGRAVRAARIDPIKTGDRVSFDVERDKAGRPRAGNLARVGSCPIESNAKAEAGRVFAGLPGSSFRG